MGGGIAQLASYGSADIYLTGNPSITFFKSVSRRHTNFAMESIQQTFQGPVDFGKKCTATISRTGDLAYTMWLQITLPDLAAIPTFTPSPPDPTRPTITNTYFKSASSMVVEALPPSSPGFLETYTAMACDISHPTQSSTIPIIHTVALSDPVAGTTTRDATVLASQVQNASSYTLYCTTGKPDEMYVFGAPVVVPAPSDPLAPVTFVIQSLPLNTATFEFSVSVSSPGQLARSPPVYATVSKTREFTFVDVRPATYSCKVISSRAASQGINNFAEQTSLPQQVVNVKWCNSVGHALIQSAELELGGSRIDRHVSEWFDIRSELMEKDEKLKGFHDMVGKYATFDMWNDVHSSSGQKTYFVPLVFYSNRSPGMAIPLIALQFHELKLNFEFRPFRELVKAHSYVSFPNEPSMTNCKLYVDYIFLDQPERIRYAQIPHEYLIEQIQYHGSEPVVGADNASAKTLSRKILLNFNHPVKEILWVYSAKDNHTVDPVHGNSWFDYHIPGKESSEVFKSFRLQLNGADRFNERPGEYFRKVQPYQHHTRCPLKRVYVYSFALNPEDMQPSGTCNMSRIDSATFNATLHEHIQSGKIHIFAVSYNVLRISNGMGGLAFVSS